MNPDSKVLEQEQEEENKKLKVLGEVLPMEERKKIAHLMHHQEEFQKQQAHQNLDCLPKVTLYDVPVLARNFHLKQTENVLYHPTFTNGFVYADLVMDLAHLSIDEIPYAQLFVSLMSEVGVGKRSYVENLEVLQASVGAMNATIGLYPLM
jgi:Zn-dependent M16 (insulinase) family peptidase